MVAVSLLGLVWAGPATIWPGWSCSASRSGDDHRPLGALGRPVRGPAPRANGRHPGGRLPLGAAAVPLGGAAWLDAGGSFTWVFASGTTAALAWAGIVGAVTRRAR
jgi:hypothetical protein